MIERYATPFMKRLWSDASRYQKWFEVELAALDAWAEEGVVPKEAVADIRARGGRFDIERMAQIEAEVHHDVVAFTQAVAEAVGPSARYFHYGLTSSDVTDTALCLLLRQSLERIEDDLDGLLGALKKRAVEERATLTVGRTHGMMAEPMALGLKFALVYAQLGRDHKRLSAAHRSVSVGKLSGAVGTFSQTPPRVEERALGALSLEPAPIASQILQRDRHAEVLSALAILAGTLEKLALDIRLLQRSEIRELAEPFSDRQKGSSAMPHKRNPVRCERICGLARLMRSYAMCGLENIALWHERDISHSSVERITLADATTLADYMILEMTDIVDGLFIDRERMEANLLSSGGVVFSQKVLLALAQSGLSREEAYRIVQSSAMRALSGEGRFQDLLWAQSEVRSRLTEEAFSALFDVAPYLGAVDTLLSRTGIISEEGNA